MKGKVLVAARGEIAVRIIRAARELNLETVAIFTRDDAESLHTLLADEVYPVSSYLSIGEILDVIEKSKANLVHPGYGFLAENPYFAREVEKTNAIFVGPTPEVMKAVGDKVNAKKIAENLNIPVLPWSGKFVRNTSEALKVAEKIGYPVLLKAIGGGGGIGIRIVRTPEELSNFLEIAEVEAKRAFGDGSIYIEKYIERPRHIEVQILGDNYGNIIHLHERECSIQRRFQKLIEESPSPALSDEERNTLFQYALKYGEALKYRNAGTVEFLYKNGRFYFTEVNARLQVEHGVTEMVTGVDIVKMQLLIALDKPLPYSQEDIKVKGCSIEARINAENPLEMFKPSPGMITKYCEPGGFGVRVDSGIYQGFRVSDRYNPLIAKLITWGTNRAEAISRMRRALSEFIVSGVETTIPLLKLIFRDEDFVSGRLHTSFLDEKMEKYISELRRELTFKLAIAISTMTKTINGGKVRPTNVDENYANAIPAHYAWKFSQLLYTYGG